jgi:hypothetical protein
VLTDISLLFPTFINQGVLIWLSIRLWRVAEESKEPRQALATFDSWVLILLSIVVVIAHFCSEQSSKNCLECRNDVVVPPSEPSSILQEQGRNDIAGLSKQYSYEVPIVQENVNSSQCRLDEMLVHHERLVP